MKKREFLDCVNKAAIINFCRANRIYTNKHKIYDFNLKYLEIENKDIYNFYKKYSNKC